MSLLLDSLLIENYRCFKELLIEKLGRVNLIVGKNNAGKTALLEALRIYASGGNPWLLVDILEERNEGKRETDVNGKKDREYENNFESIRFLYHGRNEIRGFDLSFSVNTVNHTDKGISVSALWLDYNKNNEDHPLLIELKENVRMPEGIDGSLPILFVNYGHDIVGAYPLDKVFKHDLSLLLPIQNNLKVINYKYVPANLSSIEMTMELLWSNIALTSLEDEVITTLQIISPEIRRLTYLRDPQKSINTLPFIKMDGVEEPLSLKSFGEGINRLFSIALALVNAKDGFLLIDEIDTGLYHRIQADVWKIIFRLSKRLNVQIFATTHSWDCVEAFNEAVEENEPDDAMLIRLENNDGVNRTVLYDKRRIGIAARDQIEVR